MTNDIKCPKCGHVFELNESLKNEVEQELRAKMLDWQRKKEEDFEKQKTAIETAAHLKANNELSVKLKSLEDDAKIKNQMLQELQRKELDFIRQQNEIEQRNKNFEIEKEKYFLEKSKEIETQAVKKEQELFDMKMKEKDTQLESMKNIIADLKRKSEQGSMQLQGEAQELLLEQILRETFPFDAVDEIKKGTEGADCIQTIRNNTGKECGKIIYESKRTKAWQNVWIDKLKTDKRNLKADVAILVSQCYPKGMDCFGEKDGVWICSFSEVAGVAAILRYSVLNVYEQHKSEESKGDKMHMLYNYLTGVEFKGQVEAIAEGFLAMKSGITRERMQMEKIWKEREKQLEKVLISTSGLYGSVKGIAGASIGDIPLLDGGDIINEIEY
jgi:hypothetical protein